MTALDRAKVSDTDPLRLDIAAAIAFPDGSMSASGLRKEAERGRLVISFICGRYYVTLSDIARMVELCRVAVKVQDSNCEAPAATPTAASPIHRSGSSETADTRRARDAALTTARALKKRSPITSRESTSSARGKANVIHLKSRSRTS